MSVLRLGVAVLLAISLAACGETAAPVNVEGTVQARVSATVGAAQRAQTTATRPPAGTTVIPLGSPALSPAPNIPGVGTPFATAAAPAAATATGTVLGAGLTPVGTPAVTPSGTAGTPGAATSTPVGATLALGAVAPVGGLALTITRYEWGSACPTGGTPAGPGRKFVVLQAAGRNDGSAPLAAVAAQFAIENVPAGTTVPCLPAGRPLDEACYRSGVLAPGARCEGWLLFEVPESLNVPGAIVTARSAAGGAEVARWRLPS